MTNLTPAETPDGTVPVPDEGEQVTAVSDLPTHGPVRKGYQALFNKIWCVFKGKVHLRALSVYPVNTGTAANPADGEIYTTGKVVADNTIDIPAGKATLNGPNLKFTSVSALAAGGNPASTVALSNDLRPVLILKAWCRLTTPGDGSETLTTADGANIASAALVAAQNRVTINFASDFANTNYVAQVTASATGGLGELRGWAFSRAAGSVTIQFNANPRADVADINVTLFGRQST